MNDNRPLLEVQNLKKYFKTKRGMLHAVDDVTFTIGKGKTLGVVGESGCGKSTTGRAILRLIEPTGGCVLFDGEDISRLSNAKMRAKRREMQIIFQDPFSSLDPRMSVSQIIEEPMRLHGMYKSSHERETQTLTTISPRPDMETWVAKWPEGAFMESSSPAKRTYGYAQTPAHSLR